MLRVRMSDGPRKGEIVEVSCEAGWAMLKDGRATDPRLEGLMSTETPAPAPVAEVKLTQPARPRRGGSR